MQPIRSARKGKLCVMKNTYYFKLDDNDIKIFNHDHLLVYSGHLNTEESGLINNVKLVFNLEATNNFVGGKFILEKNNGTLIMNGSGIPFFNAFRGQVYKI
jgi:hypothetical protein